MTEKSDVVALEQILNLSWRKRRSACIFTGCGHMSAHGSV